VHKLALNDSLSSIQDPDSEERIQSMLMHSRYTGQSLGFIALNIDPQTKVNFKSSLVESMLRKLANEHWQAEISRKLRKELRLIDNFYKDEDNDRLLLLCPGLNENELAKLSAKLEKQLTEITSSSSICKYATFPDQALTLDGLLTQLDTNQQLDSAESASVALINKFENDTKSSSAVRSG